MGKRNQWRKVRRWVGWIFARGYPTKPQYGKQDALGALTWLFGIIIGQGAGFAASVKEEGRPYVAILAYFIVAGFTVYGTALLINAKKESSDGALKLVHSELSVRFGRWLQLFSLVYAGGFILASYLGLLPGQTGSRIPFLDDEIPCEVRLAKSATKLSNIGLTGQSDPRELVDQYVLDTLKRWLQTTNNLDGTTRQILMVRQQTPFKNRFKTFSVTIDLRYQTDGSVEFVDALAFLGKDLDSSDESDPLYRFIVGAKVAVVDRGGPSTGASPPPNLAGREYQQIPLPLIQAGRFLPVVTVNEPNKGDSILMFVLVRAGPKTTLKDDPGFFRLKVTRVR